MNNLGNVNQSRGHHEVNVPRGTDYVPVIADVVGGCDRSVQMALWGVQRAVAQNMYSPNDMQQPNQTANQEYSGVQEAA